MVADDEASRRVWLGEDGALAGAKPGTVLIEASTLSPVWVRQLAAIVSEHGCGFLDAPVTGSKTHAASGELLFLAGGEASVLERALPVLKAMSRDVMHLGPVGSGALMKLVNNFLCGVQAAAFAEGLALIEKSGLDREQALAVLINGAPGSPVVKTMAARMGARDYTVNFHLELMQKDLAYSLAEAERHGVALGTAAAARQLFQRACEQGLGKQDFAAVIEPLRA
jgi:3-hydroxyisobutyrate dehydrogenase